MRTIAIVAAVILAGWWLWPSEPTDVWAVYYPDRDDLFTHVRSGELASVEECRDWAYRQAAQYSSDPDMLAGDYECGVGFIEYVGSVAVYRETVR